MFYDFRLMDFLISFSNGSEELISYVKLKILEDIILLEVDKNGVEIEEEIILVIVEFEYVEVFKSSRIIKIFLGLF